MMTIVLANQFHPMVKYQIAMKIVDGKTDGVAKAEKKCEGCLKAPRSSEVRSTSSRSSIARAQASVYGTGSNFGILTT